MSEANKLIQASPTTRSWLRSLCESLPQFTYGESKHWASFRSSTTRQVIAYLNPTKQRIRLFLPLSTFDDTQLQPTPSTSNWAKRFPAIFTISDDNDIAKAARLILTANTTIKSPQNTKTLPKPEEITAEELPSNVKYMEGVAHTIVVNAFERNRRAREKCIEHYGRSCTVCSFNFLAQYGESAAGYIQVHHIVPIANIRREYSLDPISDLRPVCANCHAVIHRRDPPFSIDEVKKMLEKQR